MNVQQYLTPENVTLAAGVAGGVVALALVGLAIWKRRSISMAWQSIFSQGGLFYIGMGLFMLASVVEAGPVLNKIAMHGTLWGYGGHMLVFAFDMISAVSLRARLNARRVFDTHGMKLQMWGICLPAAVSVSANLAGAIQGFNQSDFNHLFMFAWLLPLIGAVFPSMIIVLSLAADHLLDTTAVNVKIDPEDFRKQEKKRVEILKVRLETEQELLKEESKIAVIRGERDQAREKKPTYAWFFTRWLRPHATPPMAAIKAEIERAVNEARKGQEQQAQEFAVTLSTVQQALATISDQLTQQMKAQSDQIATVASETHLLSTIQERTAEQVAQLSERTASPRSARAHTVHLLSAMNNQKQVNTHGGQENGHRSVRADDEDDSVDTEEMENIDLKQRVADKWAEMPEATARQIADALGCSRSTAGKWMKIIREEQRYSIQAEGSIA
jgi:Homeodomain-like domain